MPSKSNSNELTITRVYNAKIQQVWDAWVDPKQVAKWWGPRGFTLTTKHKDVRTGGEWIYTMHGPDGVDWPNHTKFLEVEKFKRLVYDHGGFEDKPPMFRVTVLFSEIDGKTKMDMTMAFANKEIFDHSKKIIKDADGNSTWDRLAEYLNKELTGKEKFVINRTFDTDIETLFNVWTEPKHLIAWSGPIGARMEYIHVDIKTGGKAFYKMPFGEMVMYGNVQYVEVSRPSKLIYIQQFANADGSPSRHPMAPNWPQSMLTTITLSEEEKNRTRLTLEWEISGDANELEIKTFVDGKKGMSQGWSGSFQKLDEYLRV